MKIIETSLFVRSDGTLRQVVLIQPAREGPIGDIVVEIGGAKQPLSAFKLGKEDLSAVAIQEVREATPARFSVSIGGHLERTAVTLHPQKHWTIYLAQSVHTDFPYNDFHSKVYRVHNHNLDKVIQYCHETADWPDGARYRWNCEVTWQVENYASARPPEEVAELMELARKGEVEVGALYAHTLTELCSSEELIRQLYYGHKLRTSYGIPIETAIATDTPGYTWALASVLAASGVKYMSAGMNNCWGPFDKNTELKTPFYWVGPDGGRILVWFMQDYAYVENLGFNDGYEIVLEKLPRYLSEKWGQESGYPYDILLLHGAYGDNMEIRNRMPSDVVRQWNERWAYPQIRLATNREFFKRLETEHGQDIPEARGDWSDYWADGAASSARETAVNRATHENFRSAELAAETTTHIEPATPYPAEEIQDAFKNMLFYDDATWGADYSIRDPESSKTRALWAMKSSWANGAAMLSDCVLEKSLFRIASHIPVKKDPVLIVWNLLPWQRTDVTTAQVPLSWLPQADGYEVIDIETGESGPVQILPTQSVDGWAELAFLAERVPATGYRAYQLKPAGGACHGSPFSFSDCVIENEFYRLELDRTTGAVASLHDKETSRELVDRSGAFGFNQYIYDHGRPPGSFRNTAEMLKLARGPGRFRRSVGRMKSIRQGVNGPVMASLVTEVAGKGCETIEQHVILFKGVKRIEIANRLLKEETLDQEGAYYAFPFAIERPTIRCEISGAVIEPERMQLSGSCRDWYGIQRWVDISDDQWGVIWSPREAPLVEFGDIHTGRWLKKLEPSAMLFSYIFNNYWWTNYCPSQRGPLTFSYTMAAHRNRVTPGEATRLAMGWHCPLAVTPLSNGKPIFFRKHTGADSVLLQKGYSTGKLPLLPEASASFCELDTPNAVIVAYKRAEDGRGSIVRLLETNGTGGHARLRFPSTPVASANLTTLMEEDREPLPVTENTIAVPLKPLGFSTLRIQLAGSR